MSMASFSQRLPCSRSPFIHLLWESEQVSIYRAWLHFDDWIFLFQLVSAAAVCRSPPYAAISLQSFANESICLPGTSWGWHGLDWVMLPWQRLLSASWSPLQRWLRRCRPSSSQSPHSVHSPRPDGQRKERAGRLKTPLTILKEKYH